LYKEVDVSFNNTVSGITLAGTLTIPLTKEKHAAVVLVSGSGPNDRDSAFLEHKPFAIIADHLAKKGIIALRFDKRGVGESTGDYNTATTEDFVGDVSSAIEYLQSLEDVNTSKIGLIGHSEGGLYTSMAASRTEDLAFIVLLAGLAASGTKNASAVFTLLVNEDNGDKQNFDDDKKIFDRFFGLVRQESLTQEEKEESIKIAKRMFPRINEETKAVLGFGQLTPEIFVSIFSIPWMHAYLNSSSVSYLRKAKCPVLAIYGEKDVQVPAKENIEAINNIIGEGENTDYTIIEIPNVNHLFQYCETGYPSEYGISKQSMVAEVLNIISDWIASAKRFY
jgi:alpha/beta superfamily hydrolase